MTQSIFLGAVSGSTTPVTLDLKYANRHGLIAGATGTGKTVTLQVMAEGFSKAGVPVFLSDVKGDLGGLSAPSAMQDFLVKRAETIGYADYAATPNPVIHWDVFGQKGHPLRATLSEVGPLLLARMLDLNETQEGVLTIAFKLADDDGLLLLDMKDLQALLTHMAENTADVTRTYGNVTTASIGSIQRKLLMLEEQGGDSFFGEPALDLSDFMRTGLNSRGYINVLNAEKLMQTPRLYATFLLWLLSELFEQLPEVGDAEKPKLVFFFDEAHLLFNDAPKPLLEKIEQVVRLIRSKGVGIYFISQNPADIPDSVSGQLGCRVQHALRAFTPQQQKGIKTAAETFRPNPKLDTEAVLQELGIGEALVSTLGDKATPTIVERVMMAPPTGLLGPAPAGERERVLAASPVKGVYDAVEDRASAYEKLKNRAEAATEQAENAQSKASRSTRGSVGVGTAAAGTLFGGLAGKMAASMVRTIGTQIGREIIRGVLGGVSRRR